MPQYEFECIHCFNKIELLQKVRDPNPTCSSCGIEMKKLISRTSFSLRGQGWFRDGYTKTPIKSK